MKKRALDELRAEDPRAWGYRPSSLAAQKKAGRGGQRQAYFGEVATDAHKIAKRCQERYQEIEEEGGQGVSKKTLKEYFEAIFGPLEVSKITSEDLAKQELAPAQKKD